MKNILLGLCLVFLLVSCGESEQEILIKNTILLKGDEFITLELFEEFNDPGAIVGEGNVVVDGEVDTTKIGEYIIKYSDEGKQVYVERIVQVIDTISPKIITSQDIAVLLMGQSFDELDFECKVEDNYDDSLNCEIGTPQYDSVVIRAIDSSGNSSEKSIKIIREIVSEYKYDGSNRYSHTESGHIYFDIANKIITKLDLVDNPVWKVDVSNDISNKITVQRGFEDSQNNILVIGSDIRTTEKVDLLKFSKAGELMWQTSVPDLDYFATVQDTGNGYLFSDQYSSFDSATGLRMVYIDYNGNEVWTNEYSMDARAYQEGCGANDQVVLWSIDKLTVDRTLDEHTVVLSSIDGSVLYETDVDMFVYDVFTLKDGTILVKSEASSFGYGVFLLEYIEETNEFTEFYRFEDQNVDYVYEFRDGTILLIGGDSHSNNSGHRDEAFFRRIDREGNTLEEYISTQFEGQFISTVSEVHNGLVIFASKETYILHLEVFNTK
ncbi:DUF5011 domain-containing protein [Mycoplasmatota bacterium zrk1]